MSLGTSAYYSPRLPTSDPFQFGSGRYSSSDGLKLDVCGPVQSGMMYDGRRDASFTPSSSFLSATAAAAAFDVRGSPSVSNYEYAPSPQYTRSTVNSGEYCIKAPMMTGDLDVAYRQGLGRRVHGQSTTVNHVATSPQSALGLQPAGFAIYPWMRSMNTGTLGVSVDSVKCLNYM